MPPLSARSADSGGTFTIRHPDCLTAGLLADVLAVAGTGRFLPYDHRWSGCKDEHVFARDIIQEPGLVLIASFSARRVCMQALARIILPRFSLPASSRSMTYLGKPARLSMPSPSRWPTTDSRSSTLVSASSLWGRCSPSNGTARSPGSRAASRHGPQLDPG